MRIHIAQKGETLWTIAKKYGVNFEELKNMNAQLSNPNMIMPGMKIKIPGTGATVKKEMPTQYTAPKEAPKAVMPAKQKEMPKAPAQPKAQQPVQQPPKEIIKEVKKEVPYPIFQPVMPQMPEIDINNYYTMHMNQMQAQVQQAAQEPKEIPVEESPIQEMPVMPAQQMPVAYAPPVPYCYPIMPVCDPCYPYPTHGYMHQPMMPQVQGAMMQPMPMMHQPQPMPMMQQPQVLPGSVTPGYDQDYFGDESDQMEMHYNPYGVGGESLPHIPMTQTPYPQVAPMTGQGDCGCGHSQPATGYYHPGFMQPPMPHYGAWPTGVGQMPYGHVGDFGTNPYAMPHRHVEEEDESTNE